MLKAAAGAYLAGVGAVFLFSTLFFAFQIFRPGSEDIWNGGPEDTKPGKVKVFLRKAECFYIFAALALLVAAVWPATFFITVAIAIKAVAEERRRGNKDSNYRR